VWTNFTAEFPFSKFIQFNMSAPRLIFNPESLGVAELRIKF
jgi:hypothetical protein